MILARLILIPSMAMFFFYFQASCQKFPPFQFDGESFAKTLGQRANTARIGNLTATAYLSSNA